MSGPPENKSGIATEEGSGLPDWLQGTISVRQTPGRPSLEAVLPPENSGAPSDQEQGAQADVTDVTNQIDATKRTSVQVWCDGDELSRDYFRVEAGIIAHVLLYETPEMRDRCRGIPPHALISKHLVRLWRLISNATDWEWLQCHPDVVSFREFAEMHWLCQAGPRFENQLRQWCYSWIESKHGDPAVVRKVNAILAPGSVASGAAHKVTLADAPPEGEPRFSLSGIVTSTPGNLTALFAPLKSGKTAVIGAMIGAVIRHVYEPEPEETDTLGFTASPPDGRPLLFFDTEQAERQTWELLDVAHRRAGGEITEQFPSELVQCWNLTDLQSPAARLEEIERRVEEADLASLGGVFAVLIDGAADLLGDINDITASVQLRDRLMQLASRHYCPVITAVHVNEGAKDSLARGHLGRELMRKAETNLQLEKDSEGVTTISAPRNRKASIVGPDSVRFRWDLGARMHKTVDFRQTAAAKRETEKMAKLQDLAEQVFNGNPQLAYVEVCERVGKAKRTHSSTSMERAVTEMRKMGVIKKNEGGKYELVA